MDKTVRVWDVATQKCEAVLKIDEKPTLYDQQLGICNAGDYIFSISLRGSINMWQNFYNGKLPD